MPVCCVAVTTVLMKQLIFWLVSAERECVGSRALATMGYDVEACVFGEGL